MLAGCLQHRVAADVGEEHGPVGRDGNPNRLRQSLTVRVRHRADHLSLAVENEDLAGVRGGGVEITVRVEGEVGLEGGRETAWSRRWPGGDRPLRDWLAVGGEDRDARVAGVGDVDVPVRTERDTDRLDELVRSRAVAAPGVDERAVRVKSCTRSLPVSTT